MLLFELSPLGSPVAVVVVSYVEIGRVEMLTKKRNWTKKRHNE